MPCVFECLHSLILACFLLFCGPRLRPFVQNGLGIDHNALDGSFILIESQLVEPLVQYLICHLGKATNKQQNTQ